MGVGGAVCVLAAVDLNDQAVLATDEVADIGTYRNLPREFEASQLATT